MASSTEHGNNVKDLSSDSGTQKVYNTVYIRYGDDGDNTHAVPTLYTPGDLSDRDVYGELKFEKTIEELTQNISSVDQDKTEVIEFAERVYDEFSTPKKTYAITSSMPVFLMPLDRVELNSKGMPLVGTDKVPARFGFSKFGDGHVIVRRSGPLNERRKELKILKYECQPDKNVYKFLAKEI